MVSGQGASPGASVIYSTGFEASEGFNAQFELAGQNGWAGEGSGGNGLAESFPGHGQQAFIGFFPPTDTNEFTSVWRPVNAAPVPAGLSVVKFSVLMQIVDSTNARADDFRWSVYSTNGHRFFTVDFADSSKDISYLLDDGKGFAATNFKFDNNGVYDLVIWMNLARNLWTASLNEVIIANSKPITTTGASLNLGDVDAVWFIRDPKSPGNNYMLFDDYKITAEPFISIPPVLEALQYPSSGNFLFRIYGEEGLNYVIEVTDDLKGWVSLGTFGAPAGGSFDFEDTTAPGFSRGFYRVFQGP
ncbi:MAG: hypothetical protein AAB466_03505 [Verrucomicrobiota bacterium]